MIAAPRPNARPDGWAIVLAVALLSPVFGAAMGLHDPTGERWLYAVYGAVKLPLMIAVVWVVCLPGFYALCSVLSLRDDLRSCLRAIGCGQAAVAFALSSLAPVLLFFYACGLSHRGALLVSGGMFLVATVMGQVVMVRWWRPMAARSRRHTLLLGYWFIAYVFVGTQAGWMLRPFVGSTGVEPAFVRQEPMTNAYVVVFELISGRRQ